MPVNSYIFTYKNVCYNFNVKSLGYNLFKVQFSNSMGDYSLPQKFLLNTKFILVFLPEEPNAVYETTSGGYIFLKSFSEDLKKYILEFA
jgi:hypothetical protein